MLNEASTKDLKHPITTKPCQISWSRAKYQNVAFEKSQSKGNRSHHGLAVVLVANHGDCDA